MDEARPRLSARYTTSKHKLNKSAVEIFLSSRKSQWLNRNSQSLPPTCSERTRPGTATEGKLRQSRSSSSLSSPGSRADSTTFPSPRHHSHYPPATCSHRLPLTVPAHRGDEVRRRRLDGTGFQQLQRVVRSPVWPRSSRSPGRRGGGRIGRGCPLAVVQAGRRTASG